jgi:hypothetical protein
MFIHDISLKKTRSSWGPAATVARTSMEPSTPQMWTTTCSLNKHRKIDATDVETTASAICPVEGCNFAKAQLYSTAVAAGIMQHYLESIHPAQAQKWFDDTLPAQKQKTLPGQKATLCQDRSMTL